MKLKIFIKQAFLVVVLAVCIVSVGYFLYFRFPNEIGMSLGLVTSVTDFHKTEKADLVTVAKRAPLPVRIEIASIEIDAGIEYVNLGVKGAVGAPKGPSNAGWFDLSPRPGETGNSIIVGHSGYKNSPAIFDNLHKIKKGDSIEVKDKDGKTTTFIVQKIKSYGKNEQVEEIFISKDGKAHLILITCAGDWNALERTHESRLVVFADKK